MRRRTLATAAVVLAGCGLSALGTQVDPDAPDSSTSSSSGASDGDAGGMPDGTTGGADAGATDAESDAFADASDASACSACDGGLCAANVCKRPVFWVRGDDAISGSTFVWPDRSGNGNDAVQATAGLKPAIPGSMLNGHRVVRFPNSARLVVANANAFMPGTGDVVWFHVSSNAGNNAVEKNQVFGTLLDGDPFSGVTAGYDMGNEPYGMLRQGTDVFFTVNVATQGGWNVVDLRRANGVAEIRRNGTGLVSGAAAMNLNGGRIVVGSERATGTEFLDGDIAEIILFAGVPFADAERSSIAKQLGALYGITVQ